MSFFQEPEGNFLSSGEELIVKENVFRYSLIMSVFNV